MKTLNHGAPHVVWQSTTPGIEVVVCERRKAKIRAQEPAVRERYKQERIEKEARIAEMEANKAANMIEHEDEIQARPARSWFMSGTQKQALKDATKFAVTVRDLPCECLSSWRK
jgi:hypothetical protein